MNCTCLSYIFIYKKENTKHNCRGEKEEKILGMKNSLNFNIDYSNVIWDHCDEWV